MPKTLLMGAAGGAVVGFAAYLIIGRYMDAKLAEGGRAMLASAEGELGTSLRAQLDRQIPPLVHQQMTQTLNGYGLTPQTGQQIARVLSSAERYGLLGLRRA